MYSKPQIAFISIFVAIEIALLICVLTCNGAVVSALQFSAVALAFIFSVCFISIKDRKITTQSALIFTLLADIFLILVSPRNQALAMTFFSISQILYFVKLLRETQNKTIRLCNLILRIILIITVQIVTLIVLKEKADYIAIISMFYFTNIVLNMVFALINIKTNPMFAIGLICFLICDIFIGLNCAVGVYINVPETSFIYKLAFPTFNFAWLFYIPSQTLIALNSIKYD